MFRDIAVQEPKGSRLVGAALLIVIIVVVFIGLWAFLLAP
jgi:hypothetical protein